MFIATLICSDEACALAHELVTHDLELLDTAACPCGCTLVVLDVSDWSPATLQVRAARLRPAALAA